MSDRYLSVNQLGHPRASMSGHVHAHVLVAETALGHYLPPKAVVHHIDSSETKQMTSRLVICQDQAYHRLLHMRIKALRDCGNANWIKCRTCKQYDAPENLVIYRSRDTASRRGFSAEHHACKIKFHQMYWHTTRKFKPRKRGTS